MLGKAGLCGLLSLVWIQVGFTHLLCVRTTCRQAARAVLQSRQPFGPLPVVQPALFAAEKGAGVGRPGKVSSCGLVAQGLGHAL